jgi:hypothetical protein
MPHRWREEWLPGAVFHLRTAGLHDPSVEWFCAAVRTAGILSFILQFCAVGAEYAAAIPITSVLGRISVVPVGETGTIPYSMC